MTIPEANLVPARAHIIEFGGVLANQLSSLLVPRRVEYQSLEYCFLGVVWSVRFEEHLRVTLLIVYIFLEVQRSHQANYHD